MNQSKFSTRSLVAMALTLSSLFGSVSAVAQFHHGGCDINNPPVGLKKCSLRGTVSNSVDKCCSSQLVRFVTAQQACQYIGEDGIVKTDTRVYTQSLCGSNTDGGRFGNAGTVASDAWVCN